MKQQVLNLIDRALSNPHTTLAGVAWAVCKLGEVWWPAHAAQFKATEALAVSWGLFMAGDSNAKSNATTTTTATPVVGK